MKHTLLLNPFSHDQEPARKQEAPARKQEPRKQEPVRSESLRLVRSTPVCSTCQSDDIVSHAIAQWSNESQEWVLANTFDRPTHCNICNCACSIAWLPLN